jgi:hemerythrin-like domain-containing protein
MEIETLAAALEREHRDIDEGIAAFTSGAMAENEQSLSRAIHALRRHIYLEEEFLFPLMREKEPALSAPVFVMLREHGQLWQVLDSLEQELNATASGDGLTLCRRLTVLLLHHNLKEEKILYPRADDLLPESAAVRLREFIASGQLPPGWSCAKA